MHSRVFGYYKKNNVGLWEKRYILTLSADDLQRIFIAFIENDFLTIKNEDRTGVPDETRIRMSVTNAKGEYFFIETWEDMRLSPDEYQNSPRRRFDNVCLAIKQIETIAIHKDPVSEGCYPE